MSAVAKIVWVAGLAAVVGLIFSTGVAPVEGAFEAAGFGVAGVCLLRGVAVACAGLAWFVLFPPPVRPNALSCVLTRVAGKRAWLSFGAIEALYSQLRSIYGNRSGLIAAFAIHSAIWLFGALEVLLILIAMGLPASYPEALIIESLLQAIRGAAFAIPGALGAQEGGLIAICALFWLPAEAAIAMSLIKRVPDVVFGVPSLLGWQMLEGWTLFAVDDPRIPAGGGWQWLRHPLPASVRSTATPLAQAPPRSPPK